jgi:hypothetical protein
LQSDVVVPGNGMNVKVKILVFCCLIDNYLTLWIVTPELFLSHFFVVTNKRAKEKASLCEDWQDNFCQEGKCVRQATVL